MSLAPQPTWTFGITYEDKMDSNFPEFRVGCQAEFAVMTGPESLSRTTGRASPPTISHVDLNRYYISAEVVGTDSSGNDFWRLSEPFELTGLTDDGPTGTGLRPGDIVSGRTHMWIAGDYWAGPGTILLTWVIRRIQVIKRNATGKTISEVDSCWLSRDADYLISCELVEDAAPKEDRTDFAVALSRSTERPAVLTAVSKLTGLSRDEALSLIHRAPTVILDNMTRHQQNEALRKLKKAGARAEAAWTYRKAAERASPR
jgi:ribosomal protein L7/L12